MKTEMAEMRAEMASVAAEMAQEMSNVKAKASDETNAAMVSEVYALKTTIESVAGRLVHLAMILDRTSFVS